MAGLDGMVHRTLEGLDREVSALCFGTWGIGGGLGSVEERTSRAALDRALERGVTFFDTADNYGAGRSETLLGEAIRGGRDRVVIATKAGHVRVEDRIEKRFDRRHLSEALSRSLDRLGTDRVDIFQIHNPPPEAIRSPETRGILEELRDEGLARAVGASVHTLEEARAVVEAGTYDVLQIAFNVATQWVPCRVVGDAREAGIGVIAREPLAQGMLSGKYDRDHEFPPDDWRHTFSDAHRDYLDGIVRGMRRYFHARLGLDRPLAAIALQFALQDPRFGAVNVSCKTPSQVDRNVDAVGLPPLPEDALRWLRED